MKFAHPYEEVAYQIYAIENENQYSGLGMFGELPEEMEEKEFSNLKCNLSKINPLDVSIYEIREGVVRGTIQGEDGLISDNYFDQKMKDLMDDWNQNIRI